MIIGVDTENRLWARPNAACWHPVPDSGSVLGTAVLPTGTIIAAGTDANLYTRVTLGARWSPVSNAGGIIDVAVLPDGTIVGVGSADNQLRSRKNLEAPWLPAAPSHPVRAVATLLDGTLLGVGLDELLYTRRDLAESWWPIAGSGGVESATVLGDGSILGVTSAAPHDLTIRRFLYGAWATIEGSGPVRAVSTLPDGSILGVGPDRELRRLPELISTWTPLGGDPEPAPIPVDWLLTYTSPDYASDTGDGRPWGDGTAMAARAAHGGVPWDTGCLVTPLVGGAATMDAICDVFEAAIRDAQKQGADGVPPGRRGCVNIAGWLFNPLRDLSSTHAWGGAPWDPGAVVAADRTALGLVLRMMSAGIVVRLMLWRPAMQQWKIPLNANEHWNAAAAIQDHDAAVRLAFDAPDTRFGTVLLDSRKAARATASIRQKTVTVRVGRIAAAFCGSVDLAFARRDFGLAGFETAGAGDWQSGRTAPLDTAGWPKQEPAPLGGYPAYPYTSSGEYEDELPPEVYGAGNRVWHDQHLKLEGPIVATLEEQFAERWITEGKAAVFDRTLFNYYTREPYLALVTDKDAVRNGQVVPLPPPDSAPVGPAATGGAGAVVQMWRTAPLRPYLTRGPFLRGEFTVMAGVAKAISRATQLITVWDQYFWSTPLVRLLAHRLRVTPELRALIVLPPYGAADPANELGMRKAALQALWHDLDDESRARVLVRDAWAPGSGVGVYVHAKTQTYDDALLVAGSADMSRRSFECDVELDCAVLHRPTVSNHLARLYAWAFGAPWTDFDEGWLTRYWREFSQADALAKSALVRDPFFAQRVADPRTPNGVPMPSNGWKRREEMDPSSISGLVDMENRVCADATCPDDPNAPGRLDQLTHLLERCDHGGTWPFRIPAGSMPFAGGAADDTDFDA